MSYMVDGGINNRPRFRTLDEANACANEYMRRTGIACGVYIDQRNANATYKNGGRK